MPGTPSNGLLAMPARVIAACFALTGFTGAVLIGVLAENPAFTILLRALGVMIGALLIGRIIGSIAQRTVLDTIARYKDEHPIPDESMEVAASVSAAPPPSTSAAT